MTHHIEAAIKSVFQFSESEDDGMVSGIWYPTFELMGSDSGRFKNATGTVPGVAINPPFDRFDPIWPFDWSINGKFDMGKKK